MDVHKTEGETIQGAPSKGEKVATVFNPLGGAVRGEQGASIHRAFGVPCKKTTDSFGANPGEKKGKGTKHPICADRNGEGR